MADGIGGEGVAPCGRATCGVCGARIGLLGDGAEEVTSATLVDGDCNVSITDQGGCTCQSRLRLDIPGAAYRSTGHANEDSKMCDFAILATDEGRDIAVVVELKRGIAEWPHAGEQLEEGLRVLHERFIDAGLARPPRACLAVGKQASQLRNLIRSSGYRAGCGFGPIPVEVIDCGSEIDISRPGVGALPQT